MALEVERIPIEIQFAQGLAGNEQKNRDKTLVLLKKFIRLRLPRLKEQLKEDEFIKLWKGMHYQLWMQDKPLIQEKLVEDLCQLVHDFPDETYTLMFIKAFFDTEAREWYGLDQWRMNKFMMLVREFLHNSLVFLKNYEWRENVCEAFSHILEQSVMDCRNLDLPIGLKLHLMDIFPEELRKVADDKLSSETAVILLSPFLNILPTVKNENVMKKVLTLLFKAGGGQELPKARRVRVTEDGVEEDEETDAFVASTAPRDTDHKLHFNKELLLNQMMDKGSLKKCRSKNRSRIYQLIKRVRYLDTNPQKAIITTKPKDMGLFDIEVSEKAIGAAVKRLKKNKDALLEKIPLRKDYKLKMQKEKKVTKKTDITEADTEEDDDGDGGMDMEGLNEGEGDDDSLEFDPEEEFLQMSTESDDEKLEMGEGEEEEDLSADKSLPNGHVEDGEGESAESEVPESPAATAPESPAAPEPESPAVSKKNKKSKKAGSKRKLEESVEESATPAPEKKVKKAKKEKAKKKKLDVVDDDDAAAAEEMEVVMPEEKKEKKEKEKKAKKKKLKRKSDETSVVAAVPETEPMFGMVDFPEEDDEAGVVVCEMPKSPEETEEVVEKVVEKLIIKKVKVQKVKKAKKRSKKSKKSTIESAETDDQIEETADLVSFPLPTDAKDSVDVSNLEAQNTLQVFEHLKKMKEEDTKLDTSQVDIYIGQVQKEADSIEEENKTSDVIEEEKDASVGKEEGVTSPVPVVEADDDDDADVPVIEAELPVTKGKSKKEKGKKKISLLVKGKKTLIIKGLKSEKKVKSDPESDSSDDYDHLFAQPPAFLRNAIAKAGKTKKVKKSKKSKSEKSEKKTPSTSTSPGDKHVVFNMERNKAQAFLIGGRISNDENAFQPSRMPDIGILKPSPSPIRVSKKFSMDKKLSMLAKPTFMAHFF